MITEEDKKKVKIRTETTDKSSKEHFEKFLKKFEEEKPILKYFYNSSKNEINKYYKRKKLLTTSKVNPLLVIFSVRDIEGVNDAFNEIDFIDKLWIKNFKDKEAQEECVKWIAKHPEYTHIILTSDDILITSLMVKKLLEDILIYDFPVLTGCCNTCGMYREVVKTLDCQWCIRGEKHPYINVTFDKVVNWDNPILITRPKTKFFHWIKESWRKRNQRIRKVWFSGLALGIIRRDIFDKWQMKPNLLKTYIKNGKIYEYNNYSYDFSLAVWLHKHKIFQFCDLGVKSRHFGTHHNKLKIGIEKSEVVFDKAKKKLSEVIPKLSRILICTPFNNESHSLNKYIKSIINIDYPKELIDLVWYENDSVDTTWIKLVFYFKKVSKRYNYNSIKLFRKDFGLSFGKISVEDFGRGENPHAGKNYLHNYKEVLERAARLNSIYNYFFDLVNRKYRYLMIIMADIIVPNNIIERFLKGFREHRDAGWVGGVHHTRYPLSSLAGPLTVKRGLWSTMTDKELIKLKEERNVVFECGMTGHAWMMPSRLIRKGARPSFSACELVAPMIYKLWELGYRVYCDIDVYLKHISLDGKIYRHNIYDEVEKKKKIKGVEGSVEIKEEKLIEKTGVTEKANFNELEEYLIFVERNLNNGIIPDRPREDELVTDNIYKELLTQEDWDRLYGKWRKYIEKGHQWARMEIINRRFKS